MAREIRSRQATIWVISRRTSEGGGQSQARLTDALITFSKPLVAAVRGAAVGSGTTMLLHFDFVYAAENAKFQMPFVNLALVPEFGSSYLAPAQAGYIAAAELILLGSPFDARRALELGFVTRVVSDEGLLATAWTPLRSSRRRPPGCCRRARNS